MEFTKEKTNIAKGIAICLMIAFHLYTFEERLINGNTFIPTIPFFNAEHYLGNFGNICVSIFLFLSGYGMYLGSQKSPNNVFNYAIAKLKDLYINRQFKDEMQRVLMKQRILRKGCDSQEIFSVCG
jgi:uncharacterized membrane protein